MNLLSAIKIYGGGPGSGCHGEDCGRPLSAQPKQPAGWRKYDPRKVGGFFRKGTRIANMYEKLQDGKWHPKSEFATEGANVEARFRELRYTGDRANLWTLRIRENEVQLIMRDKNELKNLMQQPKEEKPQEEKKGQKNDYSDDERPIDRYLLSAKVTESQHLGGGVNDVRLVKFSDGTPGIWKPQDKEADAMRANIRPGKETEREVAAWEVAKIVGMDDLTTPAVIRTIGGERGALLQFNSGKIAAQVSYYLKYDGAKDAARIAVFDYVIGNEDRHSGNWMVKSDKSLKLIDHGLTFPDKGEAVFPVGRTRFANASATNYLDRSLTKTPSDYADDYKEALPRIQKALSSLGLQKAFSGVQERVNSLAGMQKWTALAAKPQRQDIRFIFR